MPGLIRLIAIGILVGIIYSFYRKFQKKLLTHKKSQAQKEAQEEKNSSAKMLRCEHCGVYLPEPEAIKEGEHVYCSEEHKKISQ